MRAVHEDHAASRWRAAATFIAQSRIAASAGRIARAGRLAGIDQDLVERAQALPLGQRIDFDLPEVQRFGNCFINRRSSVEPVSDKRPRHTNER